jgi:hypothetical protein
MEGGGHVLDREVISSCLRDLATGCGRSLSETICLELRALAFRFVTISSCIARDIAHRLFIVVIVGVFIQMYTKFLTPCVV